MAQLTVSDVSLGYDSNTLVEHLSFEVNTGDYLCIVGENGSGKTTLMKTLLGLQKPLAGSITFGDGLKANEIGYLPQQTEVQRDFPLRYRAPSTHTTRARSSTARCVTRNWYKSPK